MSEFKDVVVYTSDKDDNIETENVETTENPTENNKIPKEAVGIIPDDSEIDEDSDLEDDLDQNMIDEISKSIFDTTESTALVRLKYLERVRNMKRTNTLMTDMFLYVAKMLQISLPVTRFNVEDGELISYTIQITGDPNQIFSSTQIAHIAALIKSRIDATAREGDNTRHRISSLNEKLEAAKLDLNNKNLEIKNLLEKTKHPTLEVKPYVIAYMNDKGDFVFLGKKIAKNGKEKLARTKDFSKAIKFANQHQALTELTKLLEDCHSLIVNRYRFNIFSVHMIMAEIDNVFAANSLKSAREACIKYETVMKAASNAKKRKKKSKTTRK